MTHAVRWRLAGMMALVYAVQGAWWPLLTVHLRDLGISGRARGWIFSTMALAALATPLLAGQIADRRISAQRLLALIYALGTGFLVIAASGLVSGALGLFALFLGYWLLIAPGLSLSNSIAFRNLERPAEQFGGVRLCGTAGWMLAGWLVSAILVVTGSSDQKHGVYEAFWLASVLSCVLAFYARASQYTSPG